MFFKAALAVCLLPVFAAAQYGYGGGGGTTPTTSAASGAAAAPSAPASTSSQVNIDVAFNQTFTFNPANVNASVGTLVTFYFPTSQIAHSVTQSSFADPCTYLAANGSTSAGFDSGLTSGTQFSINITDASKPIWFHCKQVSHCGLGMVGSINAPSAGATSFSAFQAAAMQIGSSETAEKDNGPVTGGVNGVATAGPSTASASGTGSSGSSGSSGAEKVVASAGIALLASVVVAFIV